jgi:hypothetical protein
LSKFGDKKCRHADFGMTEAEPLTERIELVAITLGQERHVDAGAVQAP